MPSAPPSRPADLPLRDACLVEARKLLAEVGHEGLSLRKVARRLGVSHQAPYKHFANKDEVVAALVEQAFAAFADHLEGLPPTGDPHGDMGQMGAAYVRYAREHPLEFRLMFGAPLPDPQRHAGMAEGARRAFDVLRHKVAAQMGLDPDSRRVRLDAMYVWSTVHGLTAILEARTAGDLGLTEASDAELAEHVIGRIGTGLRV